MVCWFAGLLVYWFTGRLAHEWRREQLGEMLAKHPGGLAADRTAPYGSKSLQMVRSGLGGNMLSLE